MPFANISALLPCPFTGKGLGKGVGGEAVVTLYYESSKNS